MSNARIIKISKPLKLEYYINKNPQTQLIKIKKTHHQIYSVNSKKKKRKLPNLEERRGGSVEPKDGDFTGVFL